MFKFIRISHLFKNLLIFFPIIVSSEYYLFQNLTKVFSGLFIFFLVTNLCYLINDYSDRHTDKFNKLKDTLNKFDFKNYLKIIILLTTLIIFSLIYLDQLRNYFIFLYFINFILYNFYFKQKKYFDLIMLTNFYLIRVFYGCQLFELNISIGFIIFLYSIFFSLSAYKRLVQVKVNNIDIKSKIIPYTSLDNNRLKKIIFFSIFVNFFIFQIYFTTGLNFLDFKNFELFYSNFQTHTLIYLNLVYIFLILRIIYTIRKNLIKEDIYNFFTKDKVVIFLLFILVIVLINENFI